MAAARETTAQLRGRLVLDGLERRWSGPASLGQSWAAVYRVKLAVECRLITVEEFQAARSFLALTFAVEDDSFIRDSPPACADAACHNEGCALTCRSRSLSRRLFPRQS